MTYRYTLPLLSAAALLLGGAILGCNNDPEPVAEETMDTGLSAGKLAGMPSRVQTQIMADMEGMPGYSVQSYDEQVTAEGILYRVTMFDGEGGVESRTYNRDGVRVVTPAERSAANAEPSEPLEQRASDSTLPPESSTDAPNRSQQNNQDDPPRGLGPAVGGGGNLPR